MTGSPLAGTPGGRPSCPCGGRRVLDSVGSTSVGDTAVLCGYVRVYPRLCFVVMLEYTNCNMYVTWFNNQLHKSAL